MICCRVEDNGVGRKQAATPAKEERKSLGMKITRARIEIFNRVKKANAGVRLSDLTTGTLVEVRLPLVAAF